MPSSKNVTRKSTKGNQSVWRALQRIHRRDLILLSGVLSLACVSVVIVGFIILQSQSVPEPTPVTTMETPGPRPTHTVTFVQVTGLKQYDPVRAAAAAWSSDAQLVSANAHWPSVIDKAHVGEPTLWTYRFYSPAKARLFFATITPEGRLETIEHAVPVTLPPSTIAADSWLIDSSTALAIWLDYGGAAVLGSNPGLEMMVQLRSVNNNPNPVWLVIGLNNQTQSIYTVTVDASHGVVTATQMDN